MSYLISKQKSNGAWDDPNRLYDRGMKVQQKGIFILFVLYWLLTLTENRQNICPQGGVGQAKDEVPLTAFLLISMNHALKVYELGSDTELVTY